MTVVNRAALMAPLFLGFAFMFVFAIQTNRDARGLLAASCSICFAVAALGPVFRKLRYPMLAVGLVWLVIGCLFLVR